MRLIQVDHERCRQDGICIESCPVQIIALAEEDGYPSLAAGRASFCIRCGHCLEACPLFLNPQALGSLARKQRYEEMEDYHLFDCMLCGCCAYECPSNIPLSQLFAVAKGELMKRKAKA